MEGYWGPPGCANVMGTLRCGVQSVRNYQGGMTTRFITTDCGQTQAFLHLPLASQGGSADNHGLENVLLAMRLDKVSNTEVSYALVCKVWFSKMCLTFKSGDSPKLHHTIYLNEATKLDPCQFTFPYQAGVSLEGGENTLSIPDGGFENLGVHCKLYQMEKVTFDEEGCPTGSGICFPPGPKSWVERQLKAFLEQDSTKDFKLISQGEVTLCHKELLQASSSVFRSFVDQDMPELREGHLHLTETYENPITVKRFVHFLYTEELDLGLDRQLFPNEACKLMRVAMRFNVQSLVTLCLDVLKAFMDGNNCAKTLLLAKTLGLPELEGMAYRCTVREIRQVILTPGWIELLTETPSTSVSILQEAFEAIDREREMETED